LSASIGIREDCVFDGTRDYYIDASQGLYGQDADPYNDALDVPDFPAEGSIYRFSPP